VILFNLCRVPSLSFDLAMTLLSVNVNKIAVLRNSRGGSRPDPCEAARVAVNAGAHGITVHPRPDQRHIRPEDVLALSALSKELGVEFNIEGNPFAPARGSYPGLLELVKRTQPAQVTLVPDSDHQTTSDHGFDLNKDIGALREIVAEFKRMNVRVSVFMDADCADFSPLKQIGVDRIELYTGPYAESYATAKNEKTLQRFAQAAQRAQSVGLGVNAGHDLSQQNLGAFLREVPTVLEVSIGHALFEEAIYQGLSNTIARYLQIMNAAASQILRESL
jgi:pyridoxine 5-phosphate synthase